MLSVIVKRKLITFFRSNILFIISVTWLGWLTHSYCSPLHLIFAIEFGPTISLSACNIDSMMSEKAVPISVWQCISKNDGKRFGETLRTGPPRKRGPDPTGIRMPRARARPPAWRFGGSLRVAANAVVKFTIARINRRDNDYYFRAACPRLSMGSRRFADRRISRSAVVQSFVHVRSGRAGAMRRAHCPTSFSTHSQSSRYLNSFPARNACLPPRSLTFLST